jgi:putative membrane protein
MLLAGRGLEAIQLTVIGGIGATILFVLLTPVLLFVLPVLYTAIKHYIHWILLLIVFIMLSTEKNLIKIGWALIIFCLAGLLGLIVLNSALLPPMFVFFPLFTGLFGISTLLISLRLKVKIPQQVGEMKMVDPRLALGGIGKAFCSGMLLGIMPGVGAAQAAVLAQELTRRGGVREFLVSVGGINTAVALFSLISLYTINRARSGAAITVEKIIGDFGFDELILLLGVGLVAIGISAVLTLGMGKKLLGVVEKIPYEKISLGIICFLILLTIAFVGLPGLLVLAVSTTIGLLAPLTGVKRSHCMGVLILPVIIFYSGIG